MSSLSVRPPLSLVTRRISSWTENINAMNMASMTQYPKRGPGPREGLSAIPQRDPFDIWFCEGSGRYWQTFQTSHYFPKPLGPSRNLSGDRYFRNWPWGTLMTFAQTKKTLTVSLSILCLNPNPYIALLRGSNHWKNFCSCLNILVDFADGNEQLSKIWKLKTLYKTYKIFILQIRKTWTGETENMCMTDGDV